MTLNCIYIFIVTGSLLYWCVMRPASQRFFIHSCIYLRILIISYLATFLGTNSLFVLMCRKTVNLSINQANNQTIKAIKAIQTNQTKPNQSKPNQTNKCSFPVSSFCIFLASSTNNLHFSHSLAVISWEIVTPWNLPFADRRFVTLFITAVPPELLEKNSNYAHIFGFIDWLIDCFMALYAHKNTKLCA